MTGRLFARWLITPVHPPMPSRHCGTCGTTRLFASSGHIRLNANGKKLDAWLIYRCVACDRTWNRPLLERVHVQKIDRDTYRAMQSSRSDWVATHEFDLDALATFSRTIEIPPDVQIAKHGLPAPEEGASNLRLEISATRPTGVRLDRLLATEFGVSRSGLEAMRRSGRLRLLDAKASTFRRALTGTVTVEIEMTQLAESVRSRIRGKMLR